MTEEKWKEIVFTLKSRFEVDEEGEESLENGGIMSFLVFESPIGIVRLERSLSPKVLEKKTTYSNRIGSNTKVDYVYSEEDFMDRIEAFLWNEEEEDWKDIDASSFL